MGENPEMLSAVDLGKNPLEQRSCQISWQITIGMARGKGRKKYEALRQAVEEALSEADPTGLLATGVPQDEYDPEIGTILPRLARASSASTVKVILHEEFVRWFGPEVAGSLEIVRCASKENLGLPRE